MRKMELILAAAGVLAGQPAVLFAQATGTGAPPAQVLADSSVKTPVQESAVVLYHLGLLEVRAQNSSLSEIVREVAGRTGMKITGTVKEERIFGSYGPGTPASVLTKLLEGTGINMMLRASSSGAPEELILTERSAATGELTCSIPPCSVATASMRPMQPNPNGLGADFRGGSAGGAAPVSGAPAAPPVPYGTVDPATGQTVWPEHHVTRQ